jgi:basic amino acid/polyamine antiporter, APA family
VAASRLLFAFGRRRTIPPAFARIDPAHLTPSVAIAGVMVATLVGLLVGDALLVPVTEVGSMASAFGWLATCLSFYMVERGARLRLVAAMGILVSLLLVLMKWVPGVPGHFTLAEWIALSAWLALGLLFHWRSRSRTA